MFALQVTPAGWLETRQHECIQCDSFLCVVLVAFVQANRLLPLASGLVRLIKLYNTDSVIASHTTVAHSKHSRGMLSFRVEEDIYFEVGCYGRGHFAKAA